MCGLSRHVVWNSGRSTAANVSTVLRCACRTKRCSGRAAVWRRRWRRRTTMSGRMTMWGRWSGKWWEFGARRVNQSLASWSWGKCWWSVTRGSEVRWSGSLWGRRLTWIGVDRFAEGPIGNGNDWRKQLQRNITITIKGKCYVSIKTNSLTFSNMNYQTLSAGVDSLALRMKNGNSMANMQPLYKYKNFRNK